jgi:hypothetical protein
MNYSDPDFESYVQKLYNLNLYGRWLFVILSWLILGTWGVWGLRQDIPLWFDYFTWTAVRYTFYFNPISTLCLSFCIAITCSVLVWQSNNILHGGIAPAERRRLEKTVVKILAKGPKHPLWRWVRSEKNN